MSEENKDFVENDEVADENDCTAQDKEAYNFKFECLYADVEEKVERKPKKISLTTFLLSLVAIVLVAVLTTWSICYGMYGGRRNNEGLGGSMVWGDSVNASDLEMLAVIFETYSYYEQDIDEEKTVDALFKAYVEATGDNYAEYFNAEEYKALRLSSMGKSEGIGIVIIYTTVTIEGVEYDALKVTNISRESPAIEAGLKVGDLILYVGTEKETRESVDSLGYYGALSKLQGASGTKAEFTVLRPNDDGSYEEIPFSVMRETVTTDSVLHHICATDSSVGIVRILGFDYTTPTQFSRAVDELWAAGATKFVFDLRYNGGGELASVIPVLSYFLDEGQTIISIVDKDGNSTTKYAEVISAYAGEAAGCNVSREDIGKYKGLEVAVLCNSSTASAAELFTATFRDYNIGTIVGETTYGKGSMQKIISLEYFGIEGALKLTTNMYFPPCGESYEGIGIVPDVEVMLDEALEDKNIYDYTDAEDNQLQAAIETMK